MTRKALHSALLEVGLFFQREWSEDRIARFTYRLRRRRIRAEGAGTRSGKAAASRLRAEQLTIGFAIPEAPRASVPVALPAADPGANERLVARVRAGLSRRPAAHERSAIGFVCAVCGEPATGWTRIDGIADGKPVIDGYATCLAHRSPESVEQLLVTRAG